MSKLDMTLDLSSFWAVLPWLAVALLVLAWFRHKSGPTLARSRHWLLWTCRVGALAALVAIGLNPVHVSVTPAPSTGPRFTSCSMRLRV